MLRKYSTSKLHLQSQKHSHLGDGHEVFFLALRWEKVVFSW